MKNKSIKIMLIAIGVLILFVGMIYRNTYIVKNNRIVIKEMSESTQVSNLNSSIDKLNTEHDEYKKYIADSKTQLATAITNKGVATTLDSTFETMTANINNIVTNPPASLISYDNTSSGLTSTNVQGSIDELSGTMSSLSKVIYNGNYCDKIKICADTVLATFDEKGVAYITLPDTFTNSVPRVVLNILGYLVSFNANVRGNTIVLESKQLSSVTAYVNYIVIGI